MGFILIKYSEKDEGEGFSVLSSPDWLSGEAKQIIEYRTPQLWHKDKQTPEGLESNPTLLNFS